MPKTVTVRYFASLREAAGAQEEEVTTDAVSLAALYGELSRRHGFTLLSSHVKASRNLDFLDLAGPFEDGDTIVFLPPVAGG